MKAYIVQYTEHADGILGIYLSRSEAEASQSKYEFETYIEEHDIKTEEKKNIYDIDYGTLFKMKNSEKTFLVIRKYYRDYERLFVDLETGLAFSRSDLICFGYCFYHDDNENIDKVKVIGHV